MPCTSFEFSQVFHVIHVFFYFSQLVFFCSKIKIIGRHEGKKSQFDGQKMISCSDFPINSQVFMSAQYWILVLWNTIEFNNYSPTTFSSMNMDKVGCTETFIDETNSVKNELFNFYFYLRKRTFLFTWHSYKPISSSRTDLIRNDQCPICLACSTRKRSSELYVDKPTVNNWKSRLRIHETCEIRKCENVEMWKCNTY